MIFDSHHNHQNGNAIVIIFVAIALFAALAFAFNQTSRTSTGFIGDSVADSYASKILSYSNNVESAIKRMRLKGIEISELDFSHPNLMLYTSPISPWPANANCTSNKCKVFHPEGGQINPVIFEDISIPYTTSFSSTRPQAGHPRLFRTNIVDVGTPLNDLVLIISRLPLNVCQKINQKYGLNSDFSILEDFGSKGNFDYQNIDDPITGGGDQILGNADTQLAGKKAGCFYENPNTRYNYFYVIEAR